MKPLAKEIYAAARALHWEACTKAVQLKRIAESADLREIADDIYALKEVEKLLEDARKEIKGISEDLIRQGCHLYVLAGDGDPIRTEYCTASPDAKPTVKLPKKDSPEYQQLMDYFGVPKDAPFSPDWNKMIERVEADLAEGKPCPKGCDPSKMYILPKMVIRKKRPILDDGEAPDVQRPDLLRRMYDYVRDLILRPELADYPEVIGLQDTFDEDRRVEEEEVKPRKSAAPSFMTEAQEEAPF